MTNTINPQNLVDAEVYDPDGDKIGKVGEVYLREDSHQPAWITVKSGLFNHKETMVPLQGAQMSSDGIRVGVTKERIKDAPQVDADGRLSEQDSAELYRHYGIQPEVPTSRGPADSPMPGQHRRGQGTSQGTSQGTGQNMTTGQTTGRNATDREAMAGQDTRSGRADAGQARGRATEGRDTEMVRSEERLNVGTEQVESGRVRLRKYVVTEQQQMTVPVSHEEVRIEREPISEADRGKMGRGGQLDESEEEIVLHGERPVVRTETVPVERIRVGKETITENQTVGGEVRKEQFEFDEGQNTAGREGRDKRDGRRS